MIDDQARSQPVSLRGLDLGAEGTENETPKASRGREWGGSFPLPSRLGGLVERRKLPHGGPGRIPDEKRFYCFLRVSERLSLQRLMETNVVHSRPLI